MRALVARQLPSADSLPRSLTHEPSPTPVISLGKTLTISYEKVIGLPNYVSQTNEVNLVFFTTYHRKIMERGRHRLGVKV
jgi:hypothetical protein